MVEDVKTEVGTKDPEGGTKTAKKSRRTRAASRWDRNRERSARFVGDPSELQSIVALLRSQGKVVVLVTGAFDLVHPGHVRRLKDAKSRGDFLIVALLADEVVRALDPSRPIQPLADRVEVLSAFGFVDYITRLKAGELDDALETILPTVLAVAEGERDLALLQKKADSLGVALLPVGGRTTHSVSDLLRRIRKAGPKAGKVAGTSRKTTRSGPTRKKAGTPRKSHPAAKAAKKTAARKTGSGGSRPRSTRAAAASGTRKRKAKRTSRSTSESSPGSAVKESRSARPRAAGKKSRKRTTGRKAVAR
jgi:cytidyltransferase-like protein